VNAKLSTTGRGYERATVASSIRSGPIGIGRPFTYVVTPFLRSPHLGRFCWVPCLQCVLRSRDFVHYVDSDFPRERPTGCVDSGFIE